MSETTITFDAEGAVTTSPTFVDLDAPPAPAPTVIESEPLDIECYGGVQDLTGCVCVVVGQPGPPGPPGPPGGGGAAGQTFTFTSALSWVVNHNLGYRPVLSLFTVGGVEFMAEVVHTSLNQAVVTFNIAQAGSVRVT